MFLINPYILQASGNPLWNDLLAYYTADNTPNDALGNYNGTLTNGATYGTGIINNGFSFDGVNDYVDLGDNFNFDGTTPFSFSAWINATSLGSSQRKIINKMTTASTSNGYVLDITSGKVRFLLINDAGVNDYLITQTTSTLSTSTWYHIVLTYDGTQDVSGVNIYVDSSNQTLSTISNNLTSTVSSVGESCKIGARPILNYYSGLIDEVGIWNRVLTSTEVTELYNAGAGKQYPN